MTASPVAGVHAETAQGRRCTSATPASASRPTLVRAASRPASQEPTTMPPAPMAEHDAADGHIEAHCPHEIVGDQEQHAERGEVDGNAGGVHDGEIEVAEERRPDDRLGVARSRGSRMRRSRRAPAAPGRAGRRCRSAPQARRRPAAARSSRRRAGRRRARRSRVPSRAGARRGGGPTAPEPPAPAARETRTPHSSPSARPESRRPEGRGPSRRR